MKNKGSEFNKYECLVLTITQRMYLKGIRSSNMIQNEVKLTREQGGGREIAEICLHHHCLLLPAPRHQY